MSDFLARLVQRTRGEAATVRPVPRVVLAPDPRAAAWDEHVTVREAPPLVRTPANAAPVRPTSASRRELPTATAHSPTSQRAASAPARDRRDRSDRDPWDVEEATAAIAPDAPTIATRAALPPAAPDARSAPHGQRMDRAEQPPQPQSQSSPQPHPVPPLTSDGTLARPTRSTVRTQSNPHAVGEETRRPITRTPLNESVTELPHASAPTDPIASVARPAEISERVLPRELARSVDRTEASWPLATEALIRPEPRLEVQSPARLRSAARVADAAVSEHSTTVEISIGRIEVRMPPRPHVADETPARPSRRAPVALADYLDDRNAGKSR